MNASNAASLARSLMIHHGIGHWTFEFDRAKRRAGLCRHYRQIISLSYHYVQANNQDEIRDTILHEIAHALVGPKQGHNAVWRAMCLTIGAKPERCCTNAIMPKGQWQAICNNCQRKFHRHRRPKYIHSIYCAKCGPTLGALNWSNGLMWTYFS